MRARAAVLTAVPLLLSGLAGPAAADPDPTGWTDGAESVVGVQNTGSTAGSASSGGGSSAGGGSASGPPCTYELVPGPPQYELVSLDGVTEGTSETGVWYFKQCYGPNGLPISFDVVAGVGDDAGAVVIDPRALMEEALSRLRIPDPVMAANPPVGQQSLVQVPTWLWLDAGYWQSRSETASAGGASATVTAQPVAARWDMGDGTVVPCDGPGDPWTPATPAAATSSCSHTYLASSSAQPGNAYTTTVTVTWEVSWTSTIAGAGGDLADQTRSTSAQIPVAEVQALRQ